MGKPITWEEAAAMALKTLYRVEAERQEVRDLEANVGHTGTGPINTSNSSIDHSIPHYTSTQFVYGIKCPNGRIWWFAEDESRAWLAFFSYPSGPNRENACRAPLAEAIEAYKSIGYKCVQVEIHE